MSFNFVYYAVPFLRNTMRAMENNKRYSVRGFVVQEGRILLQKLTDSNNNVFIDACGSFVGQTDNRMSTIIKTIGNQIGIMPGSMDIEQVATVRYLIHKTESKNNQVETAVFLASLAGSVKHEL